jgi:hypothetical protein
MTATSNGRSRNLRPGQAGVAVLADAFNTINQVTIQNVLEHSYRAVAAIVENGRGTVGRRCRAAGNILRSSPPPQNGTCEFPCIRLKHLPACSLSALVFILDRGNGEPEPCTFG